MRMIDNWVVRSGFGTFVVNREDRVAGMLPLTVQIAKDDTTGSTPQASLRGEPRVL